MANTKNSKSNNQASRSRTQSESSTAQATVSIVVACVIALLLELCNFGVLGRLGGYLKYGMFGFFGLMAYVFPIAIVILVIYVKLGRGVYAKKPVCGIIIFICLCTIMHMAAGQAGSEDLLEAFTVSAEKSTGGGIIGGIIGIALSYLVGNAGTYIIAILAILVCLVIMTEVPVIEWITGRKRADKYIIEEERGRSSGKKSGNRNSGERYDERYYDDRYESRRSGNKRSNSSRIENVYEGRDRDGNYVKIVHVPSGKKTRKYNRATLKRSENKARTMRKDSPDMTRLHNKTRGIGSGIDFIPPESSKDEFREITNADLKAKERVQVQAADKEPKEQVKVEDVTPKRETLFAEDLEKDAASSVVTGSSLNRSLKTENRIQEKERKQKAYSQAQSEKRSRQNEKTNQSAAAAAPVYAKNSGKTADDGYVYPPLDLLENKKPAKSSEENTDKIAHNIEVILKTYGVTAKVINKEVGPSVTRYELQPELGTRVNKITALADDLKLNLAVPDMRIEAPIPGKAAIGLEIPNKTKQGVSMRRLLEEPELIKHPSKIAYSAGVDISGNVMVSDIAKMPHMLVAGTTGSGKSTFLNTILMAILYRAKPSEVGLIIIDPKKIEFGVYSGLPHLVQDVVTDAGQAVSVLRWAVAEMGKRYDRMKLSGSKDFMSYNEKFDRGEIPEEDIGAKRMAQIVIVIDELADLMMVASKEVESLIVRLAQLARAAGIHLIIAMQRPSVDVVTGLIKANIPARVALKVASGIDSRTIIDSYGAEKLLGYGDMLFMPTGFIKPVRLQGAFVSEKEVHDTIEFIKTHNSADYYAKEAEDIKQEFERAAAGITTTGESGGSEESGVEKYDEFFYEAGRLCIETGKASSSMLQRRFSIGFNRAARIVEQLEEMGAVGPQNGAKPREILVDLAGFDDLYNSLK